MVDDKILRYVEEKFGFDSKLVEKYAKTVDGYAVTYKQLAFPSRFGILVLNLLIETLDIAEKGFCVFTWRNDAYTSKNLEKLPYVCPIVAKRSSKKASFDTFKISDTQEFSPMGDLYVRKKGLSMFLSTLGIKDKKDIKYLRELDDLLLREYDIKLLADFSKYEPKLIKSMIDNGVSTLDKLLIYFQIDKYKLGIFYTYDSATGTYKPAIQKALLEDSKILNKIKDIPDSLDLEQLKELASKGSVKLPSEYAYIFLAASHMISNSLWVSWHEVPWRYGSSRKFREFIDTFGGLINVYEVTFPLEILIYREKVVNELIKKSYPLKEFKDPGKYDTFDKADILFNINIPKDVYFELKEEDLLKYKSRIPSTTEYFIAKSLLGTLHKEEK